MNFKHIITIICCSLIAYGHEIDMGDTPEESPIKQVHAVRGISVESFPHFAKRSYSNISDQQSPAPEIDAFRLSFEAYGKRFFLHLEPNNDLLHPQARVNIYGEGNKLIESKPIDIRLYKGRVLSYEISQDIVDDGFNSPYILESNSPDLGWARITVHETNDGMPLTKRDLNDVTFDGVFTVNDEVYHVKPSSVYRLSKRDYDADFAGKSKLIVYRQQDQGHSTSNLDSSRSSEAKWCGTDGSASFIEQLSDGGNSGMLLSKRAEAGCPTAKKILYMGVAADCTYVSNYGGNQGALKQILSNWNQASKLFEQTFNIQLGIIKVDLRSSCGGLAWNRDCSDSYRINQRLNDFSAWRGTQNADAGLWHLMTRCGSGPTVGVAWLGAVCRVNSQDNGGDTLSGTGVSSITPNEWMVVAHEIGHNLGSPHDCTSQLCASDPARSQCCPCSPCDCQGAFIMHPTSDVKNAQFSPCSQRRICSTLASASCLSDPGTRKQISENICGNGIKEGDEQCDCGPADGDDCKNSQCCDGATCKLKNGAQCDDLNDLCCSNCRLKPENTVCRPSKGFCDIEEKCDGRTGDCPIDSYLPDLQECSIDGSLQGTCASGECTSRDLQCRQKGVTVGITGECPGYENQCSMMCQGQDVGACILVSGFFSDGTPCSYKGKCVRGSCQTEGLNGIIGWFMAHTAIGVALLVVVIIVTLVCVSRCVQLCFRRKSRGRGSSVAARQSTRQYPAEVFLARNPGPTSDVPAAVPIQQPRGWVDPSLYNGSNTEEVDLSTLGFDNVPQNRGRPNQRRSYTGPSRHISKSNDAAKRLSTPPERIRTDVPMSAPTKREQSPRKRAVKTPKSIHADLPPTPPSQQ